jgi:hypothetical protein
MAKGKLDTPILGVALGIELKNASTGPFAQFQNCGDDEDSLTKLVFQLVNRIPGSEPDQDTIRFQVGKFKSSIEEILKSLAVSSTTASSAKRQKQDEIENSSVRLFEEIKIMFQDLPSRIEHSDVPRNVTRRRMFHPGMVEDLIFSTKNPALGARVGLSLLRDMLPWIYDEGCLLLGKLQEAETPASRTKLLAEFEDLLMMSTRNKYVEKYIVVDKEDYMLYREVPRMIMNCLARVPDDA